MIIPWHKNCNRKLWRLGANFNVCVVYVMKTMNKILMRMIIFTLILSLINVSPVWSNTCSSLFDSNLLSYIEQVNKSNNQFILEDTSIEKYIEGLKNKNQKKINNIFTRLTEHGVVSEKDIHRSAEELVILLFGKRDVFLRYFKKAKDERAQESARYQIRRKLIEKGLKSFLNNHTPTQKTTLWIAVKKNVRRLFQSQFWNWYQLPWGVPNFRDKPMSESLIEKTIWDGIPAHQKEINGTLLHLLLEPSVLTHG